MKNNGFICPRFSSTTDPKAKVKTGIKDILPGTFSKNPPFAGLGLYNFGRLDPLQFKSGDYILWGLKKHIGIIVRKGKDTYVYSSNGQPNPKTEKDQKRNWGPDRGIHAFNLLTALNEKAGYWGVNYEILRIVAIGDKMLGGTLFYLDKTGEHGLISSDQDQTVNYIIPRGVPEAGTLKAIGKETDIYTGFDNTKKLIAANAAAKTAAMMCTNYHGGGYSDWYLPSSGELLELYKQKDKIGSFSTNYYTSSTFKDNFDPDYYSEKKGAYFIFIYYINFANGLLYGVDGNGRGEDFPGQFTYPPANIRAVRQF